MRETKMEAKLRRICLDEYGLADGANNDELQAHRKTALAYYEGHSRGDEVEGRSGAISQDLHASVTNNLAIMQSMLIKDCSVSVRAEGPDDEDLASAETQVVQSIIYDENQGELYLKHAFKDGLIAGNVCIEVEPYDDEGVTRFRLRAVPSEDVSW